VKRGFEFDVDGAVYRSTRIIPTLVTCGTAHSLIADDPSQGHEVMMP